MGALLLTCLVVWSAFIFFGILLVGLILVVRRLNAAWIERRNAAIFAAAAIISDDDDKNNEDEAD